MAGLVEPPLFLGGMAGLVEPPLFLGGCGFNPQLSHTKDFRNGSSCSFT